VPGELTEVDVAVVGAGAAGLYAALVAAGQGARVQLVSRSPLPQSASYWAQGGLAAALTADDSPELHLQDTLEAGRRLTRASAARVLCEEAPERVRELERMGIEFDRSPDGELMLSLEGGHSRRRVVHAGGSATGRYVTSALAERAAAQVGVDVRERSSALRIWVEDGRCVGVVADFGAVRSGATVLATGGAAALWSRTTNPPGAIGAGLLLAHEAGAALADVEFLQFHPTALVSRGDLDGFLITEAVRGEGALLVNAAGARFVDELAPRDEVACAIDRELRGVDGRDEADAVFLDLRALPAERFPNILAALARAGLDPTRELVPVAPAAHYMIGGVATDTDGRATLPGLYAVGECACTGIHGANRLASNSLSECFVYGRRAALAALDEPPPVGVANPPVAAAPVVAEETTRRALWQHAGLVRDADGLERLAGDVHPLARLVARAALAREETRGCHRRADRPDADAALDDRHLVLTGGAEPSLETWISTAPIT
jgi:L-aspartate oxidase